MRNILNSKVAILGCMIIAFCWVGCSDTTPTTSSEIDVIGISTGIDGDGDNILDKIHEDLFGNNDPSDDMNWADEDDFIIDTIIAESDYDTINPFDKDSVDVYNGDDPKNDDGIN